MEAVKTCLVEEFKSLKQKAFRNFPRALLKAAIRELPDYATVVYLTLYDLAELNIRYPGTVVISHHALSLEIGKSESSVRRAIDALKDLGYISFKSRGQPEKNYLPNIIQVCCPAALFDKIQAEESDRKPKTLLRAPLSKPLLATTGPISKPIEPMPIVTLYEEYQKAVKLLREAGTSPLAAFQEACQIFSKEEATTLQQYILELPHHPTRDFSSSSFPKMEEGCSKMNTIRSINNRDHELLLTIEKPLVVDNFREPSELNSAVTSERCFEETKNKVAYFLKPEERNSIVKKLKWMQKQKNEIHPSIQAKYPDIQVLIKEVIFHVMYRNIDKTDNFTHALRAAAKMIRNGTWSMPKRLLQMQIDEREQDARRLKQQEIQQVGHLKLAHFLKPFILGTIPSYKDVKM